MPAMNRVDAVSAMVSARTGSTKVVHGILYLAPIALQPCPGTVPEYG